MQVSNELLHTPAMYKRANGQVLRVVNLDGFPWTYINDLKSINPELDRHVIASHDIKLIKTPSKFYDKPYRTVQVVSTNGIVSSMKDFPGSLDFFDWYFNHVIPSFCNCYPIVYYETAEHKKLQKENRVKDCATRAISTATGIPFTDVFDELNKRQSEYVVKGLATDKEHRDLFQQMEGQTAADGVSYMPVSHMLSDYGFHCQLCDEHDNYLAFDKHAVPEKGTYVVVLEKHLTCVIDGKIYDNFDCSKIGTAKILEYWF